MLQAFVSLKHQQPPRTESGLQSFFESIGAAAYSPPTYFCTNVDATPVPFTAEAAMRACLDDKVKFAVIRGEEPYYWQATVLMPDKTGLGAMFFELERANGENTPTVEAITEFASRLYKRIEPRLIRIGDSEAREKLKSRHGLVLMPGLGRVEWLQVVHPDVYAELYNPSELVAAPAYQTEIWEDGALYLRVYGDPKDWENEENISLANFIPGFLAGTANVQDGEKEKANVRNIEKLWNRAQKTAERASEIFTPPAAGASPVAAEKPEPAAAAAKPARPVSEPVKPAAEPPATAPAKPVSEPVKPAKPVSEPVVAAEKPEPAAAEVARPASEPAVAAAAEVARPASEPAVAAAAEVARPASEPAVAVAEAAEVEAEAVEVEAEAVEVEAEAVEAETVEAEAPSADRIAALVAEGGELQLAEDSVARVEDGALTQPVYSATDTETSSTVFLSYSAENDEVRLLDKLEDFAAFLQGEGLDVSEADKKAIVRAVRTYHRPYLVHLTSTADVPGQEASDPRLGEFQTQVAAPYLDVDDETQQLHIWAFNPRNSSLEEILIRQFQDWPLTMEVKRHLLDLKPVVSVPSGDQRAVPADDKDRENDSSSSSSTKSTSEDLAATVSDEPKKSNTLWLLVALLVLLAVLFAVFQFVFDGNIDKMLGR